jgi:undecaprenyl-diphosphatase
VLAAGGHRRAAARGLAAAGVTWLAGQGLKRLFERPRPYQADADGTRLLIGPPSASSWPSSHPAVLLSFVEVVGRELGLARSARAALVGLAGAVGASRVIVGVHYPGDVAGGLLLGRAVAEGVARDGR